MKVDYSNCSLVLYQFTIGARHLQIVFASNSSKSIDKLRSNHTIQELSTPSVSLFGRVTHFILGVTEWIPLIGIIIAIADRFYHGIENFNPTIDEKTKKAIFATPAFNSYAFQADPNVHLSDLDQRPMNLFYKALFQGEKLITQPGSGKLFCFTKSPSTISSKIRPSWFGLFGPSSDQSIEISAIGKKAFLYRREGKEPKCIGSKDLEHYLGNKTYRISFRELQEILDSSNIYISPLLPKKFYLEMKKALEKDEMVTLPGTDFRPITMHEIATRDTYKNPHLANFINKVSVNPAQYGFVDNGTMLSFDQVMSLNLYQIGAMIVKIEDYKAFIAEGYQIAERNIGDKDSIKLISASGIRGFFAATRIPGNDQHQIDRMIMKHTFKTALQAAGKDGHIVFPAVGMGVWGGDPNIYWRAFLDAVVESGNNAKNIFINPGHQKTKSGPYAGYSGDEFAYILKKYKRAHPANANLEKITNLYHLKTDLLLLAKNLKKAHPENTVVLFNASDPDVTLGNHVGEYVNNLCHASTTEENYAAAGTSTLNFEAITDVRNYPERIIQAS